jgi:hypothetical protein
LEIVRHRSSPKGDQGTTYFCRRWDGLLCEQNYEQTKRVKAPIKEVLEKLVGKPDIDDTDISSVLLAVMLGSFGRPGSPMVLQTRSQQRDTPQSRKDQGLLSNSQ